MANCKNCGAENSALAKACPYCGMPQQAQGHDPFDETQAYIPDPGQPGNGGYNVQPSGDGYNNQPVNNYSGQPEMNGYNMNPGGFGMEQRPAPMPTGGMIALSVIAIFFCTIPGIVTLVKTLNINNAMTYAEQQARYSSAKTWGIVSIVIGAIAAVLSFIGAAAQAGMIH